MKCVERQRLEKVKLKKTIKHSNVPKADAEEGGYWSKVTKLGKKKL